jgi:hypothetical protein
MKRILFPTDFSEAATNAFARISICEKNSRWTYFITFLPRTTDRWTIFPENFEMVYDTVELTEFDMFKEEVPKLHTLATACNLDNIKWHIG